jgi:hypothetical protein
MSLHQWVNVRVLYVPDEAGYVTPVAEEFSVAVAQPDNGPEGRRQFNRA